MPKNKKIVETFHTFLLEEKYFDQLAAYILWKMAHPRGFESPMVDITLRDYDEKMSKEPSSAIKVNIIIAVRLQVYN